MIARAIGVSQKPPTTSGLCRPPSHGITRDRRNVDVDLTGAVIGGLATAIALRNDPRFQKLAASPAPK